MSRPVGTLSPMDPERLAAWEREYQAVLDDLGDPAVVADQARLRDASRRHKDLEALLDRGAPAEPGRGEPGHGPPDAGRGVG